MNFREGWLQCEEIGEGLFPEEYAVACSSLDSGGFSFFASPNWVDVQNRRVRVGIVNCVSEYCLVYLPFLPLEGQGRTVKVNRHDVFTID